MDAYAFIFEGSAGLLYLVVGLRLTRLAARTRDLAARLIGATFVLWGVSYLLYNVPILDASEAALAPFFFGGRIAYDVGVMCIAVFTQHVFRSMQPWGAAAALSIALLIVAGILGSAAMGDWAGIDAFGNAWFWVEWIGITLPFVWMAAEGWIAYDTARRRARLGLCDRLACNRLLLWSLTGVCLVVSNLSTLQQYVAYQREARFTIAMDALVGVAEIFTIGVIWLVFFTPSWYRRWIEDAPQAPDYAPSA